jgi:hypothetical protein
VSEFTIGGLAAVFDQPDITARPVTITARGASIEVCEGSDGHHFGLPSAPRDRYRAVMAIQLPKSALQRSTNMRLIGAPADHVA